MAKRAKETTFNAFKPFHKKLFTFDDLFTHCVGKENDYDIDDNNEWDQTWFQVDKNWVIKESKEEQLMVVWLKRGTKEKFGN